MDEMGDGKGKRKERKNEVVHRFFEKDGEGVENPYPEAYKWREMRMRRRWL